MDILEERLQSLMEVIHAVLTSLRDLDPERGRDVRENWNRVVAGIHNRIATGAEWAGPAGSIVPPGHAHPDVAHREVEAFYGRQHAGAAPTPPPSAPEPADADLGNTAELFLKGSTTPGASPVEDRAPPPPAPGPAPIPDDVVRELERLRAENARLTTDLETSRADAASARAERDKLRASSASPAAPAAPEAVAPAPRPAEGGAAPIAPWLDALGVAPSAVGTPSADMLVAQVAHLVRYFDKTKGNLDHIFRALEIPLKIPRFSAALEQSLAAPGSDGVKTYLEQLRSCWKVLVSGTWNHLEATCNRVQESLDPETIERESRSRREKPWETYQDQFRRLPLFHVFMESLRTQVRAGLRDPRGGVPDFL